MGLAFDHHKGGRDQWIAWLASITAEARRCIRPGGYALVWALPRTSHWTATALDDGGWRIIDIITHHFGQGFPKGKGQLKPASEHWILCRAPGPTRPLQIDACRVATGGEVIARDFDSQHDGGYGYCRPTPARQGQWTNTAGRWPPNTLFSHVGGPDGCQPAGVRRVRGSGDPARFQKTSGGWASAPYGNQVAGSYADADGYETVDAWTCVDGCPIRALDEQAGPRTSGAKALHHLRTTTKGRTTWGSGQGGGILQSPPEEYPASTGSASRFFPTFGPDPEDAVPFRYVPKASRRDRNAGCEDLPASPERNDAGGPLNRPDHACSAGAHRTGAREPRGNTHPTCKPTALMAWLVRLVTPAGGVVLDPFCGSGSTLVACVREGFGFIAIDAEPEYVEIARARVAAAMAQPPLLALT